MNDEQKYALYLSGLISEAEYLKLEYKGPTCRTCRFWNDGFCVAVDTHKEDRLNTFSIITLDESPDAKLKTGPEFGCNKHQKPD